MEITKTPISLPTTPVPGGALIQSNAASRQAERYSIVRRELLFALSVLALWWLLLVLVSESPRQLLVSHGPIIGVAYVAALIANVTAVGGGFVFLPFFSLFYGISSVESLKLALSTQAFGMGSGALHWRLSGVSWPLLGSACAGGAIGMMLGTFVFRPNESLINIAFGAISLLLGAGLLLECMLAKQRTQVAKPINRSRLAGLAGLCVAGGMINAWVSIGVGEVVALWLFFRWGFSITQAIAAGVVVLAFCSILGLLFHTGLGGIPWTLLAFTIPGVVLGGRMGAKLGAYLGEKKSGEKTSGVSSGILLRIIVAFVIFVDGIVVLFYAL